MTAEPSQKEGLFRYHVLGVQLIHLFLVGEVALVLARVHPCALLAGGKHRPEYGFQYFRAVLAPWYSKHMEFLSEQGFIMELVTHGVFLADEPCHCRGPCGKQYDYAQGGTAIVKDSHSPRIGLVSKIFGAERSCYLKDLNEEEKSSTNKELMSCVSFQQSRGDCFQHNKQVFGGSSNVCYSPCFVVPSAVDPTDADALRPHFHECFEALAKIGFLFELVIVHIDDLSDRAIAEAWWATAGKDRPTFQHWVAKGIGLFMGRGQLEERKDNILDIMFEMPD